MAAIGHGIATPVYFVLKTGDTWLNKIINSLHVLAHDIYNQKRPFRDTTEEQFQRVELRQVVGSLKTI